MAYDNRNRGSIWPNKKKEKDTHPDFTGTYTDNDNQEHYVSAWKRKPDASPSSPSLTFSLKPKDQASKPAARKPVADDMDDEIPF